jgi:LacI family transcriptional regulator
LVKRPTITDVAKAANVSVATVDRVLNGRHKVREETAQRVYDAAQKIGYHAAGLIRMRMQDELPEVRMGFVLHKEKHTFYQAFKTEIERAVHAAARIRGRAIIEFSVSQSPADFIAKLETMRDRVDVVAMTAVTHPDITDAVMDLKERGIACFAILNDFAQGIRQSYVGLNNLKVGRIAASMIATAVHRPSKIAVFVGGYRWHGHELRETGFRSYFREFSPQFTVLDTLVNLETRQLTYEATLDLLARHPDLRGIYCAGGGMEGAIAALREERKPGDVALVVNELTPESRSALVDRYLTMVIATPQATLCRDLVELMIAHANAGPSNMTGQHFLAPDLYLPESV